MVKSVEEILKLNPNRSIEIFHPVSLMTLDSMLKCLMSYESNCQQIEHGKYHQNGYIKAIYKASRLIVARLETSNFLKSIDRYYNLTEEGRQFEKCCEIIHRYSGEIVQNRKLEISAEGKCVNEDFPRPSRQPDFLDVLLEAKDADGVLLKDDEIQAEVDTFMFEGHDTTASAISWTLYRLAKHQNEQDNCYEEIKAVMGEKNDISWDNLPELPYLTMCIKESIRLHTTVPGVLRYSVEDIVLCGKKIVKGTAVLISTLGIHNNSVYWPNPSVFDPLRFTKDNIKNRPTFAFLPFSAGPRNCIGQHFAMHEMKISIGLLLKYFRIFTDDSKKVQPQSAMVYKSKKGIYLHFENRL